MNSAKSRALMLSMLSHPRYRYQEKETGERPNSTALAMAARATLSNAPSQASLVMLFTERKE